MKGAVFTTLQEMVETQMSMDMWDELIDECDLPSEGIYTSAEMYADEEIFMLVGKLVEKTGIPAPDLLDAFGKYLFGKLHNSIASSIELPSNFFDYMEKVDSVIHVEVKKLDARAETPEVTVESRDDKQMVIRYYSPKKLCHLAMGLLKGAAELFNENISISMPKCMHEGENACQLLIERK